MAIEYNTDSESHESTGPDMGSEDSETVDIPTSMIGGHQVSPGDVIRLEVVSNNEDSGTISCKYAEPKNKGGIDSMAESMAPKLEE